MMQVDTKIEAYEVNGKDTAAGQEVYVHICSHWCYDDRVVLNVGDKTFTLIAVDIKKAVDNATNVRRH